MLLEESRPRGGAATPEQEPTLTLNSPNRPPVRARSRKFPEQRKVAKQHRDPDILLCFDVDHCRSTRITMAALQAPRALRCLRLSPISQRATSLYQTRSSSSAAAAAAEAPAPTQPEFLDIEHDSGLAVPGPTSEIKEAYKPWKRQMERRKGLPGSR